MDHKIRPGIAAARAELATSAPKDARKFLHLEVKGDITSALAKSIKAKLKASPAARTIWLVVDSPGGGVQAGLDIYRALREHPAKVVANVYGQCCSAALLPYLAGDVRNASSSARFLIHAADAPPDPRNRWTADRYALHAAAIRDADAAARAVIIERAGMHPAVLKAEMATETEMPLRKAVSTGIVHQVKGMTPPLDKSWPDRARAAMRASKTIAFGADAYRFSPTYLAACRP